MNEQFQQERILYKDERCLVVNKAPGEAAEGASGTQIDLPAVLAAAFNLEKVYTVHRIDVPVTGCCLFAFDTESLAFLNKAFAKGKTIKTYWAVTERNTSLADDAQSRELRHWLQVFPGKNKSVAFKEAAEKRYEARLRYRLVGRGENYDFLEIDLLTGRHHQIRAQLAAEGIHIKGDLKYGARRSEAQGGIRLHARALSFPDPANPSRMIQVRAPILQPDALWAAFPEEK